MNINKRTTNNVRQRERERERKKHLLLKGKSPKNQTESWTSTLYIDDADVDDEEKDYADKNCMCKTRRDSKGGDESESQ